jgi:glycosyltransferase involved in cell wall biosynthesis
MKISIIGPGIMPIPPKGWGAVEALIWDYKIELEKLGHEIQIVNTPNQQEIINLVNNFKPDFVHLQYDNFVGILPHINCKNKAATTHFGYLEQPMKYGGYIHLMRAFIEGDFRIFCLSEGIKNTYQKFGCDPSRLEVTPNGARHDLFRYTDNPQHKDRSIYLAKITDRKRQYLYQNIENLFFAGNSDDNRFNLNSPNYLGEWSKEILYDNLTDYANLVLLSDGEADPLVTKEALMSGLGLVISEYSTANLDLSLPFIDVIPESKIKDIDYVKNIIINNRNKSLEMREKIRQYGMDNFSWEVIIDKFVKII